MAYVLEGKKCGAVRFLPDSGTVQKESTTKSSKMTSNAIETGSTIEDHVYKNPEQLQLSGIIIGGTSGKDILNNMWKQRDIITYTGRIRETNLIITNIKFDLDKSNRDGCAFTITLQKANIASSSYADISGFLSMGNQDGVTGVKVEGMKTTSNSRITESAYMKYVESYGTQSNNGPNARKAASYDGLG